jgi:integrase/recombinase XerD
LRRSDLERETGMLRVRGQGGKERQMLLGSTCLNALLALLDQPRAARGKRRTGSSADNDLLFCTENGHPLTKNSLTLLFCRLRKRAGMPETAITPQILRQSFALRYLQAGGDPRGLQELLGYKSMAQVRQYLRWHEQLLHRQTQKGTARDLMKSEGTRHASEIQARERRQQETSRQSCTMCEASLWRRHAPHRIFL